MSISSISSLISSYGSYYANLYSSSSSSFSTSTSSVLKEALLQELDSDDDNVWSYDEVSDYASDYEALTGQTIDVDDLFASYDADGDLSLSTAEQVNVLSDNALGLDDLSGGDSDTEFIDSIFSSSGGYSYLMGLLTQESTSSLLSQMFTNDDGASRLQSGINEMTSVMKAVEAYKLSQWNQDTDESASSLNVTT